MDADYLRYKNERQELINNIKLAAGAPPDLECKTISELMRIYYATIDRQCPQCGGYIEKLSFASIYPNNKS